MTDWGSLEEHCFSLESDRRSYVLQIIRADWSVHLSLGEEEPWIQSPLCAF